jgi:hypothetical protein
VAAAIAEQVDAEDPEDAVVDVEDEDEGPVFAPPDEPTADAVGLARVEMNEVTVPWALEKALHDQP